MNFILQTEVLRCWKVYLMVTWSYSGPTQYNGMLPHPECSTEKSASIYNKTAWWEYLASDVINRLTCLSRHFWINLVTGRIIPKGPSSVWLVLHQSDSLLGFMLQRELGLLSYWSGASWRTCTSRRRVSWCGTTSPSSGQATPAREWPGATSWLTWGR